MAIKQPRTRISFSVLAARKPQNSVCYTQIYNPFNSDSSDLQVLPQVAPVPLYAQRLSYKLCQLFRFFSMSTNCVLMNQLLQSILEIIRTPCFNKLLVTSKNRKTDTQLLIYLLLSVSRGYFSPSTF